MARTPFSIAFQKEAAWSNNSYPNPTTSIVWDGVASSEVAVGTSRRKPKGWIPPTSYSLTVKKYRRDYGSVYNQYNWSVWTRKTGCVGGGVAFNSFNNWSNALSEQTAQSPMSSSAALVAARNKIKDMKVDLGVAFAERKATARMLGDTASRIARSALALRHGSFREAARQLGIRGDPGKPRGSNWTNHWLQLQYGWKPLLSDVYGSCDALSKRERSDWRVTAKARRKDSQRLRYGPTNYGSSRDGDLCYLCDVVWDRGVFVRIDAVPDNDLTMSLSSLGVTNPLNVAWELVPYSFVVDWFLPVGNWLSSIDALLGYTTAYTSTTTYNKALWTSKGLNKTWNFPNMCLCSFDGTKECLWIIRTASSGVPQAAPPSLKDPRSLGHMANGLSLLAQAFARR